MTEFAGKSVIVTGGASGIGRGIVEAFAEAGAKVFIADIDAEKGAQLMQSLGEDRAQFISTDVSDEQQIINCISTAQKSAGRIDCLVNNAGIADHTRQVDDISMEQAHRLFDILLCSAFIASKHVAPIMREQGGGVILNTASVRGVVACSGAHIYGTLKTALIQWTKNVAPSLAADKIRINCVSPGGVPTTLAAEGLFPDRTQEEALEQLGQMMLAGQPIKRVGTPRDIANMMLFLAGEKGAWITGQNFVIDGGHSALSLEG